jgi:hypothetical protein
MEKKIPCNRVIKCDKCCKQFNSVSALSRHINRKTSCEPIQGDLHNPPGRHGCRFCYKAFKTKYILKTHYRTCKVKHGGIAILFKKLEERDRQVIEMAAEIKQLKFAQTTPVTNSNNQTIHGNNNNQVQITLNSYKSPNMDDVKLVLEDMMQTNILKALMQSIYFNPNKPENHSILTQNIKEKRVAVYDKTWKLLTSDKERGKLIDDVKSICNSKGGKLLNSPNGPYGGDITDKTILPVHVNRIMSFNSGSPEESDMSDLEVMETFHANRQLVKATKLAVEQSK